MVPVLLPSPLTLGLSRQRWQWQRQQNWNHHVGIAIAIAIGIFWTIPMAMAMAMATTTKPSIYLRRIAPSPPWRPPGTRQRPGRCPQQQAEIIPGKNCLNRCCLHCSPRLTHRQKLVLWSDLPVFTITEKAPAAPTRAFSWLKAPTRAFAFKTLLRQNAKRALIPR